MWSLSWTCGITEYPGVLQAGKVMKWCKLDKGLWKITEVCKYYIFAPMYLHFCYGVFDVFHMCFDEMR